MIDLVELFSDKRCKDCGRIEPFWRKGFLWWCSAIGKYINLNRFARTFCYVEDEHLSSKGKGNEKNN